MTKPHNKEEILRMAEFHQGDGDVFEAHGVTDLAKHHHDTASMLNDYADMMQVMQVIENGRWDVMKNWPHSWFTDKANAENAWRVTINVGYPNPPYCGKSGHTQWTGPTILEALTKAEEDMSGYSDNPW